MPIYLESIFTYRTFPHLFGSVGFTNYMHPRIGNCSSLLFVRVVYTYYLISLFSYYSVMEIINKVPVQILLLRNNLIRESCKKKKAGVGGLSELGSLWPPKYHTHWWRTLQGFDGNQIVFNHLYLHYIQTISLNPLSIIIAFLHATGFLLFFFSDRGTNFNMLKVSKVW